MSLKTLEELNENFMDEITSRSFGGEKPEPDESEPTWAAPTAHQDGMQMGEMNSPSSLIPPAGKKTTARRQKKNRLSTLAVITSAMLYVTLIKILLLALASSQYSFFTVVTASMQDEIPKWSLILVRHVDLDELKIGDNITFMRDRTSTVTHKIVDIYEDYENSGAKGYQTKGVNNMEPDNEIVLEESIVGKVVFTLPVIGAAVSWLGDHIYIEFAIFGACIVLSLAIRIIRRRRQAAETEPLTA